MSTTGSVPGANDPPSFAEIRKVLRQVARQQRETALQMKETDRRLKKAPRGHYGTMNQMSVATFDTN